MYKDGHACVLIQAQSMVISNQQVLVRRMDGSENFTREWQGYKLGFGSLNGEFWAGSYFNIVCMHF